MKKKWMKIRNYLKSERGQGMVEYGLIIALVAVVVIAALIFLGPKIAEIFTGVTDAIPATSTAATST